MRERLAQPGFDRVDEEQIRLVTIHDCSTRVDMRLDRIRLDQALAKAVNGRAGEIIDLLAGVREMPALMLRESSRQRDLQLGGYLPVRQRRNKLADAQQRLARREFGEGHRGDL